MLNYIWAGLIVFSLIFALIIDVGELIENRFRNAERLPVEMRFTEAGGYQSGARRTPIDVAVDSAAYSKFFGLEEGEAGEEEALDSTYSGTLLQTDDGLQVQFAGGDATGDLPETLNHIRRFSADEADTDPLRSTALFPEQLSFNNDSTRAQASLNFNPVRFRKMRDIAQGAIDYAEIAANLALGLIGVLALFLGLLQIADEAGIIYSLTGLVQPILKPLFPKVPDGHPALAMVSLNLLANVFGLGNAATPLGIKAMEELHELNPSDETATDAMVMLLALNTSSVQLVPPVLLVAIMGLQINQLIFSITLATLCSSIAGASAAYFLAKYYKDSAPEGAATTGRSADAEAHAPGREEKRDSTSEARREDAQGDLESNEGKRRTQDDPSSGTPHDRGPDRDDTDDGGPRTDDGGPSSRGDDAGRDEDRDDDRFDRSDE